MKIDQLDYNILDCLRQNARMSLKDIGQKIGLTSPAVAQRIQKMEQEHIIEGYAPRINYEKLGFPIQAIITVKVVFGRYHQFSKEVVQHQEVRSYYRITGDDCAMLYTQFQDKSHLVRFIDQISTYGATKTNIILEESWKQ